MYQSISISNINFALKNPLLTKTPKVNYDAMQPGGALERQINHDRPHWPKSVTGSGVACRLLLLLLAWPLVRVVCLNHEVVVFQPRTGTAPYLVLPGPARPNRRK